MSGKEQKVRGDDNFILAQHIAMFLGLHHFAEQILARVLAPFRDEAFQVRFDLGKDPGQASP